MDGLSGAASVIAVLQLLESIVKIVEFGKSVRDAPANLEALLPELKTLSAVLDQTRNVTAKSHINLDQLVMPALEDCAQKLAGIKRKILGMVTHLRSDSSLRRAWAAFKYALKDEEIALLKQSVTDTKGTLSIALHNLILRLGLQVIDIQDRTLAEVKNIKQSLTLRSVEFDFKMQLQGSETRRCNTQEGRSFESVLDSAALVELSEAQKIGSSYAELSEERGKSQEIVKDNAGGTRRSRTSRTGVSGWEQNITTPMVRIATWSKTFKVSETNAQQSSTNRETELISVVYPTRWGQSFGVSSGAVFTASARSTIGWKYTFQTFRAVPENALIFEFCRTGNVDGVKLLLSRGEASPLDRDPMGRTPLYFAAKSLKLDVAQLLLREGADPHATDWRYDELPMDVIAKSDGIDMTPRLAMIDLLHDNRGNDYEDCRLVFIIGKFLARYRPQKEFKVSWAQRRRDIVAVMKALLRTVASGQEGDYLRTMILQVCIMYYFEEDVLQYILKRIQGTFFENPHPIHHSWWIIHTAISRRLLERDPRSMRMIMEKTSNLHLCYEHSNDPGPLTPTVLVLYDPCFFFTWRDILRSQGHDLKVFVREELRQGPLEQAGWNESSLQYLFESEFAQDLLYQGLRSYGFPTCERCGKIGSCIGSKLKIDLVWRRYLQAIRRRHCDQSSTVEPGTSLSITVEIDPEKKPLDNSNKYEPVLMDDVSPGDITDMPYRVVCSDKCEDGVCVAWMFEDDSTDSFSFPSYPCHMTTDDSAKDVETSNVIAEGDAWDSMKIPGAFIG